MRFPDAQIEALLDRMYPVGSLFLSTLSTNPYILLGYGKWQAFAVGRALVGVDIADPDFDAAEKTSGTKTVTPGGTVSQPTFSGTPFTEIINHTHPVVVTDPGHTHVQGAASTATGPNVGSTPDASTNTRVNSGYSTSSSATGITAGTENPAGGVNSITPEGTVSQPTFSGNLQSNVQPSIAVFVWERIE